MFSLVSNQTFESIRQKSSKNNKRRKKIKECKYESRGKKIMSLSD